MAESLKTYLLDILSILIPGALLEAVLAKSPYMTEIFNDIFPKMEIQWINAVVYIGTAYVLGHFSFFIGSFLDDLIFEKVKRIFYNQPAIESWFSSRNLSFATTPARQDFYLTINRDDLTFKLREGNIEVKERTNDPNPESMTPEAEARLDVFGNFEYWTKWSFSVNEKDELAESIIKKGNNRWIKVDKIRIGVKVTIGADRQLTYYDIKERMPYGCQIEYTKLTISRDISYSFALEWFGDNRLDLPVKLLNEVLGDTELKKGDSMGYGEFLKKNPSTF